MLQLALIVHLGSQFVQNHVWKVRWWKYGPYLSQDSRSRNIEHILLHTGSRIWVLERYFKNWSTGPTGGWDSYIWPWGIISTTLTQVCFPSVFPSCLTKTEARGQRPVPSYPHDPTPLSDPPQTAWCCYMKMDESPLQEVRRESTFNFYWKQWWWVPRGKREGEKVRKWMRARQW